MGGYQSPSGEQQPDGAVERPLVAGQGMTVPWEQAAPTSTGRGPKAGGSGERALTKCGLKQWATWKVTPILGRLPGRQCDSADRWTAGSLGLLAAVRWRRHCLGRGCVVRFPAGISRGTPKHPSEHLPHVGSSNSGHDGPSQV